MDEDAASVECRGVVDFKLVGGGEKEGVAKGGELITCKFACSHNFNLIYLFFPLCGRLNILASVCRYCQPQHRFGTLAQAGSWCGVTRWRGGGGGGGGGGGCSVTQ